MTELSDAKADVMAALKGRWQDENAPTAGRWGLKLQSIIESAGKTVSNEEMAVALGQVAAALLDTCANLEHKAYQLEARLSELEGKTDPL